MIVGVGVDVIEVARLQRVLDRHGERFLAHVFCTEERQHAPVVRKAAAVYYAGRWAAKEAVAKALGTGIGAQCGWTEIRVGRAGTGKPEVALAGAAALTAASLGIETIHVSISHAGRLACASAVAERST